MAATTSTALIPVSAPFQTSEYDGQSPCACPGGCPKCNDPVNPDLRPELNTPLYDPDEWWRVDRPSRYCSKGYLHHPCSCPMNWSISVAPARMLAEEFHRFIDLPFEIRRQIWCLNFPDPRLHRASTSLGVMQDVLWSTIEPLDLIEDDRYENQGYYMWRRRDEDSNTWMDLQLICPEASKVFNEVYIKIELKGSSIAKLWDSFAADQRSDFGGIRPVQLRHAFFNIFADTLYLTPEVIPSLLESWSWLDLSQIRHFAIEVDEVSNQHAKTWEMIADTQSIKSLTLVVSRYTPSQYELADSHHLVDLESLSSATISMCLNKRDTPTTILPATRITMHQELEPYSRLSKSLKSQFFRDKPSTGYGPSAEKNCCSFSVTAAAVGALWQNDDDNYWTDPNVYIVPKNKQAHHNCFYVSQPDPPPRPRYYMTIELEHTTMGREGTYLECNSDGTLMDPLDGLERLFEEQEISL